MLNAEDDLSSDFTSPVLDPGSANEGEKVAMCFNVLQWRRSASATALNDCGA